MDINKWKSVAIKKYDYDLLKGLCKDKFRAPGAMISKILSHLANLSERLNCGGHQTALADYGNFMLLKSVIFDNA